MTAGFSVYGECYRSTWIIWENCGQGRKNCRTVLWQRTGVQIESQFVTQLAVGDPAHFPCLKDVRANAADVGTNRYKHKITGLLSAFKQRFLVFWWAWGSFIVLARHLRLWSARRQPTCNNWLAVWYRFEQKVCFTGLAHILSTSLAKVPQIDNPFFNRCVHVSIYMPFWKSFLCNEHQ